MAANRSIQDSSQGPLCGDEDRPPTSLPQMEPRLFPLQLPHPPSAFLKPSIGVLRW